MLMKGMNEMSLYNSLFSKNEQTKEILELIDLKEEFFKRFRDVDLMDGGEKIRVLTRTGGCNREDYEDNWKAIKRNLRYLKDYDDNFDNTFAYIEFKVPEHRIEQARAMFVKEPPLLKEKFDQAIKDMDDPNSHSYKVGVEIAEKIKKAMESGRSGVIWI